MLTYNNKILKVGSGALKFPTPRKLSIYLKANNSYIWEVDKNSSQDDLPEDFGDSSWAVKVRNLLSSTTSYTLRKNTYAFAGKFSRTRNFYIYPALCQITDPSVAGSPLTWVLARHAFEAIMAAGNHADDRSSKIHSNISVLFDNKNGTFDINKRTFFAWLAWNNRGAFDLNKVGICIPNDGINSTTMTLAEQL